MKNEFLSFPMIVGLTWNSEKRNNREHDYDIEIFKHTQIF